MHTDPKTLCPSYPAEGVTKLLRKAGKKAMLVASADDKLMGLFTTSE